MKKYQRKYWQVVLNDGFRFNAPSDKPRSDEEIIRKHGTDAVIKRVSRCRKFLDHMHANPDCLITTLIQPNGTERRVNYAPYIA